MCRVSNDESHEGGGVGLASSRRLFTLASGRPWPRGMSADNDLLEARRRYEAFGWSIRDRRRRCLADRDRQFIK